jgi:hypothetical protein
MQKRAYIRYFRLEELHSFLKEQDTITKQKMSYIFTIAQSYMTALVCKSKCLLEKENPRKYLYCEC